MRSQRRANRILAGVVLFALLVITASEFHDAALASSTSSRVDAILQGKLNLAQAEINQNGQTLAQAETALAAVLRKDGGDIAALEAEVSALQAKQAALEAEVQMLAAELARAEGGQGSAPSSTAAPSKSPPPRGANGPNATPTPTATPPPCLIQLLPICLHTTHHRGDTHK